jgi:RHH-type proline utilization regulon transcriptional repressor/proline dehydrogenase/delta 1-pyrroline-5-carboxylate dehydrogenase
MPASSCGDPEVSGSIALLPPRTVRYTASMPDSRLAPLRSAIRDHYVADEAPLARRLIEEADIGADARRRAQEKAASFVASARANARRSGLIDKFLQEYGLSTAEGVTLMRLAEALLRTPDAATADALIKDKVEAGDWAAHKGKSPFPLVNFSTRALMLTAAWLDDVEAKDPTGKIVKATKEMLDRVGEPVIRAAVAQAMRIMGEHFVLGETIEEALRRGRHYARDGYSFSFDMLGEAAHTAADAERYFNDYAGAIAAISGGATGSCPAANPGISVKLSALHPRYEFAKRERVLKELGARLRDLALQARASNLGFSVDAEESYRLDLSLDLIEALARDEALAGWEGLGVVVQAYQRRATFVIDWLGALARDAKRRLMVRLVKGAYWDSEIKRAQVMGLKSYPVFTRKVLTDISYQACARRLLADANAFYPQFATHNALTASLVREMAGDSGDCELQRLHGMGEALHDNLVKDGARSRIYAPVGGHRELLPYLVRRLLENGANSSFVNQLIDPDLSIDDVVADPVTEARALNKLSNPAIPAPRDLFSGERLSAEGHDPSEPEVAAALLAAVAKREAAPLKAAPLIANVTRIGAAAPVRNPAARAELVGEYLAATEADAVAACDSAARAQSAWERLGVQARARILRRAADLLEARAREFMRLAVREAGKTLPDAISEVREAVDFLRYYANEAERLNPLRAGGGRSALGVVVCISPWNFPLAIFLGQVSASLAAGNAVIAKPAEPTPLIACAAVELLHEAGVPKDVLHFLPGKGSVIGSAAVKHPAVKGVVFTGSTEVAQVISKNLAAAGKHDAVLIAETGGINAMIVDSTALLEQAVTDAISSAFQSAGQRCSACRIVCVQEDVADRFVDMLTGAMAELEVGDPSQLSTDVGPVIDAPSRKTIDEHIAAMERTARVVARAPHAHAEASGAFVRPVAIELSRVGDLQKEVFGPVLHIVRYKADALGALVDEINALGFGLTLGAHTRIDETMHEIAARARVGNIYINRNQIGAVVGVQPFGGEGLSGTGPKAGGPHYLSALTRRPQSTAQATIAVEERGLTAKELRSVEAAFEAALAWSACADRAAVLKAAAASARGEARALLARAAEIAADEFTAIELPGPTGESNTLRLRGRGVIICLGGARPDLDAQAALALAAGDAIIAPQTLASALCDALKPHGFRGAATIFANLERSVPAALLRHDRVRGAAFDGAPQSRLALARALAERKGPIAPLLSSRDDAWRYAVERTLTINTTAAGGDVRLLSLAD